MDTYIKDYIGLLHNKFPYVCENDLYKIVSYGFRQFYIFNLSGCDVLIVSTKLFFYSGLLFRDSLRYWNYYRKKLILKIRILFNRNKDKWDGNYYFALSSDEYQQYLDQKKCKGRHRKWFIFKELKLFKNKDECRLFFEKKPYIFKCKMPFNYTKCSYSFYEIKLDTAELIEVRESSVFKDILIQNNQYQNL